LILRWLAPAPPSTERPPTGAAEKEA
jgi:hypothetical protein